MIEIDCSQGGGSTRSPFGRKSLEGRAGSLCRDGDAGRTGQAQIHPAIVVGVEDRYRAPAPLCLECRAEVPGFEPSSFVVEDLQLVTTGHQVGETVVVQVRADDDRRRLAAGQATLSRAIDELALAKVVQPGQTVVVGQDQVHVPVAIQVTGLHIVDVLGSSGGQALATHCFQGSAKSVSVELAAGALATEEGQVQVAFDIEVEDRTGCGTACLQPEALGSWCEAPFRLALEDVHDVGAEGQ